MKTLFATLILVMGNIAHAQFTQTVVSEKTIVLPVDVSTAKLKFTNRGYGSTYLVKVIVPELINDTVMNHRNEGEDGPCLFTYDANQVSEVVQDQPEVIDTEFKITLTKSAFLVNGECKMSLIESIEADIRGFHFQHSKTSALPDRIAVDCK